MDENRTASPVSAAPPGTMRRRLLTAGGLLAAGTLAGGILAGTMSASAASTSPTTAPSAASSGASSGVPAGTPPQSGGGGSAPVRSDEKALSAADAAKLQAAALKAVPGGTVYRIETDAGDGVYEAHMKKADGSLVTVKFDANFAVTKVESGMGQGDPAMKGQTTTSAP